MVIFNQSNWDFKIIVKLLQWMIYSVAKAIIVRRHSILMFWLIFKSMDFLLFVTFWALAFKWETVLTNCHTILYLITFFMLHYFDSFFFEWDMLTQCNENSGRVNFSSIKGSDFSRRNIPFYVHCSIFPWQSLRDAFFFTCIIGM